MVEPTDSSRTVETVTSLETSHPLDPIGWERIVPLEGAFNFRDLGGYATADGRVVRTRTLFRSGGLSKLTAPDLELLGSFGLRTVLDLRSHAEVEAGAFPVHAHAIDFRHLSIMDQTWDPAVALAAGVTTTSFLHGAYTSMLADGTDRFAAAFDLLAAPGAFPAVFHCAAGKDRTGLLAMLLLGALGVDTETLVADYVLTQEVMPAFLASLAAEDSERAEAARTHPPAFFQADGPAMRMVVADIERQHGSVRAYVGSIGVTDETLAVLADELLDAP